MGSTKSHWVQLPAPKTYKEKYERLKELIYAQRNGLAGSTVYRRANEILYSQCRLIETMERKDESRKDSK